MSPLYETDVDRVREQTVAEHVEREWQCHVVKFPDLSPVDRFLVRGQEVLGLCEIKTATYEFGSYSRGFLIDAYKWLANVQAAQGFGLRPFLVAKFPDERVVWLDLMATPIEHRRFQPRNDRPDEPKFVVWFAWSQFRALRSCPL